VDIVGRPDLGRVSLISQIPFWVRFHLPSPHSLLYRLTLSYIIGAGILGTKAHFPFSSGDFCCVCIDVFFFLAMPAAMSSMGILIGVIIIIFAGCTSGIGLYFLSRCALRIERGHSSFFAVAKRTYPEAAIVFDSAIAIKCFGTAAPAPTSKSSVGD
jgi:hypothetical protein